jgi:acetyl-CoA carboxylase carboxyl transferase subunit beta
MIAGTATIEGMPCVLCAMDFAFMGGSMGSVVGELFTRASDVAAERGIPLVSVAASGGARMQENVLALMQMAKTVCAVDLLRESGVPYVSVLAHPTTGGVIASFAALGDFVIAEPDALLSFAGPRVVQETTRETLPHDFGRSESSFEHGLIDAVVKRPELKDDLGRILRLCAGGTLVPIDVGDAEAPPPGVVARVLRFLRSRPHGESHANGGPA